MTGPAAAVAITDATISNITATLLVSVRAPGIRKGQAVLILAWAKTLTGGSTTTLTFAIRRSSLVTGTIVNREAAAEVIYAAAGSQQDNVLVAYDNAVDDDPEYCLTGLAGAAASTRKEAGIAVIPLG